MGDLRTYHTEADLAGARRQSCGECGHSLWDHGRFAGAKAQWQDCCRLRGCGCWGFEQSDGPAHLDGSPAGPVTGVQPPEPSVSADDAPGPAGAQHDGEADA